MFLWSCAFLSGSADMKGEEERAETVLMIKTSWEWWRVDIFVRARTETELIMLSIWARELVDNQSECYLNHLGLCVLIISAFLYFVVGCIFNGDHTDRSTKEANEWTGGGSLRKEHVANVHRYFNSGHLLVHLPISLCYCGDGSPPLVTGVDG